jgi:hypothetical protein
MSDLRWKIPEFVGLIEDRNGEIKLSRSELKATFDSIRPDSIECITEILYLFADAIANGRRVEELVTAENGKVAVILRIQDEGIAQVRGAQVKKDSRRENLPDSGLKPNLSATKEAETTSETTSSGKYEYGVDKENDLIWVTYKLNGNTIKFPYSKVKQLYDLMPEQFTPKDLAERAKDVDLDLSYNQALALIRVFSHVEFDAEIRKKGNQLIAIKMHGQGYLREENQRKLRQELEVIGSGLD